MKYIFVLFCLICLWDRVLAQSPKVGDVFTCEDGSRGVVFWVQADGSRAWIVALQDLPGKYPWGTPDDLASVENVGAEGGFNRWTRGLQALQDTAGYQHTAALRAAQGEGTKYAAQAVDFERGWYLPSIGQLRTLYGAWGMIQETVLDLGGTNLKKENYWSSSEYDSHQAWQVYCYPGEVELYDKSSTFNVRAIRTFSMQVLNYDTTLTYQWNTGDTLPGITCLPAKDSRYEVTVNNKAGCSNSISLQVFVGGGESETIYASICRGETYTEHGFHISEAGTWFRTLVGPGECQAELCLILEVKERVETFLEAVICEGEVYSAHNFTVWEEGVYHQTWTGSNGCDSLVTLSLKVNAARDTLLYDTVCAGTTYAKYGFLLPAVSESKTYVQHHVTHSGCDSVVTLQLEVLPMSQTFFTAMVCAGSPYAEHGFVVESVEKDTLCVDTFFNSWGCDSIVYLQLTVWPSYELEFSDSVCWGETYRGYGFVIPRVVEDSICVGRYQTGRGCDSVVQLNLKVLPKYFLSEEQDICSNESYWFQGKELRKAGEYYSNLQTESGCDSVLKLTLRVKPAYLFSQEASTCENIPYSFNGRELNQSGIYFDSLRTREGCDSIFQLNLTVFPTYEKTIDTVICRGMQYVGEGFEQSEPGTYVQHLHTVTGCDSVLTLNLGREDYFEGKMQIDLEDCTRHEYLFTLISENSEEAPKYVCRWDWGEGEVSEGERILHAYEDSGRYEVAVQVVTPAGCATTLQQALWVPYYQEDFDILVDRTAVGQWISTVHFQTLPLPNMTYRWDFGDDSVAFGPEMTHTYTVERQAYFEARLTVSNSEQCVSENSLKIKVYPAIEVPNTFSPNGDGINDDFMKGCRVRIIDRGGMEVFKGENGWDGSRQGQPAPEDTYFYELIYPTEIGERILTGYITLIK